MHFVSILAVFSHFASIIRNNTTINIKKQPVSTKLRNQPPQFGHKTNTNNTNIAQTLQLFYKQIIHSIHFTAIFLIKRHQVFSITMIITDHKLALFQIKLTQKPKQTIHWQTQKTTERKHNEYNLTFDYQLRLTWILITQLFYFHTNNVSIKQKQSRQTRLTQFIH